MSAALWMCAMLAVVVFGVMLHSIATFRGDAARLRRNAAAEIAWALVPILIVIAAAAPSFQYAGAAELITHHRTGISTPP